MMGSDLRRQAADDGGTTVSIRATDLGVVVVDPIERRRFTLVTSRSVSPSPADPGAFVYPVDVAAAITVENITLPSVTATYVHTPDGDVVGELSGFGEESVGDGEYYVELGTPIKLYLHVEGPLSLSSAEGGTTIEFDGDTRVVVGARSHHKRPAATVTTTADPEDVMAAVETFGSALHTLSPERSYPTLRGHPPAIEVGDALDVPEGIDPPDSGVCIEVPPELRHVYVVAPLVAYFGATLRPGPAPTIVANNGFEHPLDTDRGFEAEAERVLKQCFLLDCVVRTEGLYEIDLHERSAVESHVPADLAALYEQSIPDQLSTYLAVDYDAVSEYVPEWRLTSHVTPAIDSVEMLPYLVDDLSTVRTTGGETVPAGEAQVEAIEGFTRSAAPDPERSADGSARPTRSSADSSPFTRSSRNSPASQRSPARSSVPDSFVDPATSDSLEQAWVGEGVPFGGSKPTLAAFENRIDRSPAEGNIDAVVVCNDDEMSDEVDAFEGAIDSQKAFPIDVRVRQGLSVDELERVLVADHDFLHYIGHIGDDGFRCPDGTLDAETLSSVGVDTFLLNACRSYRQGVALVERGGIGGVVTIHDVVNSGAVTVGRALARLLSRGFPLRAALDVAAETSIIGKQYVVVGDGGAMAAQPDTGGPNLCSVRRSGPDRYQLKIRYFPTERLSLGGVVKPHLEHVSQYYLCSGTTDTIAVSQSELEHFLGLEDVLVKIDGEYRWSSTLLEDGL